MGHKGGSYWCWIVIVIFKFGKLGLGLLKVGLVSYFQPEYIY